MFSKNTQTFCPVCKELLGWRQKDSLADFYCKECNVTYYFHTNEKVPTNSLIAKKPDCGCHYCAEK